MNRLSFDTINETLYEERLSNGLRVYLLPKEGFRKTYATFTTHYGSIDNHFQVQGGEEVQVPDGIAHFLEHKMFEKKEGDVFQEFSRNGASANAFTTFDRTSYLFSATDKLEENLTLLLDFVQEPYFTEKTVEKEKGIIEQEIRMYDDNPDFLVYANLLEGMFHEHPVRIKIAGTVESIRKITDRMLYSCYEHFYHPANMILFVVGGFEKELIFELIHNNQNEKHFKEFRSIERYYPYEPASIKQKITEMEMPVGNHKLLIGFKEKENGLTGVDLLIRELTTQIALDVLFSQSSELYQTLYDEGLIGEDFGADYSGEFTYGYSIVGGDTPDPDRLLDLILKELERIKQNGTSPEQFERSKKKKAGRFLKSLNSLEFIASQYTRYMFNEIHFFEIPNQLETIQLSQINQRFMEHFDPDQMAISIIRPKK